MRHAVLGAGGVGGLLAAALQRGGDDVQLVLRPSSLAKYPGQLDVDSAVLGAFTADVPAAAGLDGPVDVLWVTVKATGLEAALELVPPTAVGGALVVPLLNGVEHMALLRRHYARVAAAAIRVESERTSAGRIVQRTPYIRVDLAAPPGGEPAVEAVAEVLNGAGLQAVVAADEATLLWSKLAFLGPVALATSAFGAPIGDVRDRPEFLGAQAEFVAAARANGATIDGAALQVGVLSAPHGMRSSMQKDVEQGREPELDAITGPVLRSDLPVEHTRRLAERVRSRLRESAATTP